MTYRYVRGKICLRSPQLLLHSKGNNAIFPARHRWVATAVIFFAVTDSAKPAQSRNVIWVSHQVTIKVKIIENHDEARRAQHDH